MRDLSVLPGAQARLASLTGRVLRLTSDSNSLFTALVSCRREMLNRSTGLYAMRRRPQALQFKVMSL